MRPVRSVALALPILLTLGQAGQCQLATFDATNALGQVKELAQELKGYALQAQQYIQEIQTTAQLATTAASLIQHPSLGAVTGLMGMAGIDNPLPISPYAVQGLISGYGGGTSIGSLVGKLNGLGGLVTTSHSTDSLYTCTDQTFACQQQQQMAWSNAGLKGITGQIYQELTNHIPVLSGLRDQLAVSTDPAQRENIIAQLGAENAWATNAGMQLQTAVAMASAQQQTNIDRENEHLSASITAVIAAAPK